MAQNVALITGGMGGLGETISTKMAAAGYRVVVTHSPSNKTVEEWLARMSGNGYAFKAYPVDVSDFESTGTDPQAVLEETVRRQPEARQRAGDLLGRFLKGVSVRA